MTLPLHLFSSYLKKKTRSNVDFESEKYLYSCYYYYLFDQINTKCTKICKTAQNNKYVQNNMKASLDYVEYKKSCTHIKKHFICDT